MVINYDNLCDSPTQNEHQSDDLHTLKFACFVRSYLELSGQS